MIGKTLGTAALSLGLCSFASAAPQYAIYDIGHLNGISSNVGVGYGISYNGAYATGYSQTNSNNGNAVRYDVPGVSTVFLPNSTTPVNRTWSNGRAANASGLVVGTASTGFLGSPVPAMWSPSDNAITLLNMPSGVTVARLYGLNDSGMSVGSQGSGVTEFGMVTDTNTNTSSRLTTTTSNGSFAKTLYGVSNGGRIVGVGIDPNNAARNVGFVYDSSTGTAFDIGNLPGVGHNAAICFNVSSNGLVTGASQLNSGSSLPFVWSDVGGMTAVPLPTGATTGSGRGVNSSGQVVGTGSGQFAVPFFYDGTQTYRLGDLVTDPTWNLLTNTSSGAVGISDNGVIVGQGVHNGVVSGFVMVPIPEPTSVGIVGIAGATLLRRRRV